MKTKEVRDFLSKVNVSPKHDNMDLTWDVREFSSTTIIRIVSKTDDTISGGWKHISNDVDEEELMRISWSLVEIFVKRLYLESFTYEGKQVLTNTREIEVIRNGKSNIIKESLNSVELIKKI
tara:strand:+ start:667 stop:1032 length:366 start_codon:yes stop_codon:yes gene_type:complete